MFQSFLYFRGVKLIFLSGQMLGMEMVLHAWLIGVDVLFKNHTQQSVLLDTFLKKGMVCMLLGEVSQYF